MPRTVTTPNPSPPPTAPPFFPGGRRRPRRPRGRRVLRPPGRQERLPPERVRRSVAGRRAVLRERPGERCVLGPRRVVELHRGLQPDRRRDEDVLARVVRLPERGAGQPEPGRVHGRRVRLRTQPSGPGGRPSPQPEAPERPRLTPRRVSGGSPRPP